ncbi:MAG: DUF4261 domain-containing protein [Polyangiaceae bacterium]|nr:DUF4261 domain-containing protein [Polyangiaceae bacterium]
MHLTFVLLRSADQLAPEAIVEAYSNLFGKHLATETGDVLTLRDPSGTEAMLTVVAAPIATGEVEAAASLSVARFAGDIETTHEAHIIVATPDDSSANSRLRHSRIVAAIAEASDAVAIYDGGARAAHPKDFFLDVIGVEGFPVALWTGVAAVSAGEDDVQFITVGLTTFDLPDLLVSFERDDADDALGFILDVAEYMISRGAAPADGETIGRSDTEKYAVEHVRSPVDEEATVVHLDFGRPLDVDGGGEADTPSSQ